MCRQRLDSLCKWSEQSQDGEMGDRTVRMLCLECAVDSWKVEVTSVTAYSEQCSQRLHRSRGQGGQTSSDLALPVLARSITRHNWSWHRHVDELVSW